MHVVYSYICTVHCTHCTMYKYTVAHVTSIFSRHSTETSCHYILLPLYKYSFCRFHISNWGTKYLWLMKKNYRYLCQCLTSPVTCRWWMDAYNFREYIYHACILLVYIMAYLLGPPFVLELYQEVCNTASVGSACSMSLSRAEGLTDHYLLRHGCTKQSKLN